ncbi:MAG: hypothetical protein Q9201_005421 [Fulgogasparrea decipioides]
MAPEFLPQASRPYRPYHVIPIPGQPASNEPETSAATAPPRNSPYGPQLTPQTTHNSVGQPYYDNRTPGVPSHWVPLYGAAHGMFYDHVTRLFYGDGPPRPTVERADGSMPPQDTSERLPGFNTSPESVLHGQPRASTEQFIQQPESSTERAGPVPGNVEETAGWSDSNRVDYAQYEAGEAELLDAGADVCLSTRIADAVAAGRLKEALRTWKQGSNVMEQQKVRD